MAQKVVCVITVKKNPPGDNSNPLGSAISFEADNGEAALALCRAEAQNRAATAQSNAAAVQAAADAV